MHLAEVISILSFTLLFIFCCWHNNKHREVTTFKYFPLILSYPLHRCLSCFWSHSVCVGIFLHHYQHPPECSLSILIPNNTPGLGTMFTTPNSSSVIKPLSIFLCKAICVVYGETIAWPEGWQVCQGIIYFTPTSHTMHDPWFGYSGFVLSRPPGGLLGATHGRMIHARAPSDA